MSEKSKPPRDNQVPDEMVRERAYYIWEKEGRPEGRDLDHWLVAKTEEVPAVAGKASKHTGTKSTLKKATVASEAGEGSSAKKKKAAKPVKKASKKS